MFLSGGKSVPRWMAIIAILLGLVFGFWIVTAGDKDGDSLSEGLLLPTPAEPEESAPNDAGQSVDAAVGQDMIAPGGAVMPGDLAALDLSVYNRELSRNIPIKIGMDRYLAKDELLLLYNAFDGEGPRPRVSSTERIIDGAGLFIIRRTGLADDSVAAEETMIRVAGDQVVDFGTRIKCARGPNTTQWTTELCP